jgi:hypothetical protein
MSPHYDAVLRVTFTDPPAAARATAPQRVAEVAP